MKSQTATEYLIILAVVIIIALITIGVMGGIPGVGSGTASKTVKAKLASANVGIDGYAIGASDSIFFIKNNLPESILIQNITIENTVCNLSAYPKLRSGQIVELSCSNVNGTVGTIYEHDVTIDYTEVNSGAQYSTDNLEIVGTVTAATLT